MGSTAPPPPTRPAIARQRDTLARMVARFRPLQVPSLVVLTLLLARTAAEIGQPWLVASAMQLLAEPAAKTSGVVPEAFRTTLLLLAGVMVAKQVLFYAAHVGASRIGQDLENGLRADLFDKVLALRFRYHDENRSGETIARALRDMEQAKLFYREVWFGYLQLALLLVAALIAIAWQHPVYLLAIVPIYTVALGAAFGLGRRVGDVDREVCDEYDGVCTVLTENVAGARVVRAFGREREQTSRFGSRLDAYSSGWARLESLWTGVMPLVNHLYPLALAGCLGLGAWRMLAHDAPLQEVLMVLFCARLVQSRIRPVMRLVIGGQKAVASASRVFEVLDREEIFEAPAVAPAAPPGAGEVVFEDVHFAHRPGTPILAGVSLRVPAGSSLGLIGPTGAGKSTLVHLLPRFYDPDRGHVRIDGVDVKDWDVDALRASVALVFQEPFLFSDTVAGNVAYGQRHVDPDDVARATRIAEAHDFVQGLPEAYETVVGERGVSLSGGQRQRLTVARALACKPRVLVLDDATASLDAVTERRLFDGLEAEAKTTVIVISQRVPSVRWCDRIAVMDGGRITAVGTHDELLASSELYREIDKHQRLVGATVGDAP
ncbi:MAG: ABC transporter ATP-binding protein [Planctomycetota bacterium]